MANKDQKKNSKTNKPKLTSKEKKQKKKKQTTVEGDGLSGKKG